MTAEDLIADLRSRINPIYAAQLGTESYERRICAEALEAQLEEIERLRSALTVENDDEACFPNDTKVAVLSEARYWELREIEQRYRYLRRQNSRAEVLIDGCERGLAGPSLDEAIDALMAETANAGIQRPASAGPLE